MGTGNILETIQFYLSYPFVWYALITGTLIALCSSLLGVTLVLKRFSYIGDGLSHVAFGALAVASLLDIANSTLVVMPVTIIVAVLLLRTGKKNKDSRGCGNCYAVGGFSCSGVSNFKFIFCIRKYFRGCMQYTFWFHVNINIDKG